MAWFLVRALSLAPSSRDRFTDMSGTHRQAVNTLAAHGITLGCGRDRYGPDDPIR